VSRAGYATGTSTV